MSKKSSDRIRQNAQNVGKHAVQVGGDYTHSSSINLNLLISVFFISVLALGGLAWAINAGIVGSSDPQTEVVEPVDTDNL